MVHLAGPLPLGRLDEIRVEIAQSNDRDYDARLVGDRRVNPEQLAAQPGGAYKSLRSANEMDHAGKTAAPFALVVGKGQMFTLTRTEPPPWWRASIAEEQWRDRWRGQPVRLILTCRRDGIEPWVVPYEVEVPVQPQV